MYVLSLDEFGQFESMYENNAKKETAFVGGVLYDDGNFSDEVEAEKGRIKAYYQAVIEAVNRENRNLHATYPRSLHVESKKDATVARVKEKVKKTLPEFLTKGTFEGKPLSVTGNLTIQLPDRRGKYYIYCIVKGENGKDGRLGEDVCKYVKDDYAANLYFHMASDAIERAVFLNPYAPEGSKFLLHIATRSSANYENKSDTQKQLDDLGYQKNNNEDEEADSKSSTSFFTITNKDIYRSVISSFLTEHNPKNVSVTNMKICSINYKYDGKNMEYLYLADSVCSILSYNLKQRTPNEDQGFFQQISERMNTMVPKSQQLLFVYNPIDHIYSVALEAYQNGDYCKALSECYQATRKLNDVYSKHYKEHWFQKLEDEIVTSNNLRYFERAVNTFYNSQLVNGYDSIVGLYIQGVLEKAATKFTFTSAPIEKGYMFFKLYAASMVACNHVGDSRSAEKYYELAKQYVSFAPTEEFLRIRNILSVMYSDTLQFEKAYEFTDKTLDYQRELSVIRDKIANAENPSTEYKLYRSTEEAKTLSQMGQVCSYMRDSRAPYYFSSALIHMVDRSANYYITLSYQIHYYLDTKDKIDYDVTMRDYCHSISEPIEQLRYIIDNSTGPDRLYSLRFAIYLFIKGVYTFYLDKFNREMIDTIKKLIKDAPKEFEGHPSQLTYKYLVLASLEKGFVNDATFFENMRKQCMPLENEQIVNAITLMGDAQIANAKGKFEERDTAASNLVLLLRTKFPNMENFGDDVVDPNERYELVNHLFGYTYN